MAWLEVHQPLPSHHKTLAVAEALDIDPVQVVGHMVCLWLWALDNAPDGVLRMSVKTVARAAQWNGDPQTFIDALTDAGFLDNGTIIHDWREYAGRLIDRRRAEVKRVQEWRKKRSEALHVTNADATQNERVTSDDVTRNVRVRYDAQYSTVQNTTEPVSTNVETLAPETGAPDAPQPASESTALAVAEPVIPMTKRALANATHPYKDLWDAFTVVFGPARSGSEQKRRAAACKDAKIGGATGAEIITAAEHWPNVMRDATMTETGIVANLGKLLTGPQRNGRSAGTTLRHEQKVVESATVNRGPKRGVAALEDDTLTLSQYRAQQQEARAHAGQ